MKRGGKKVRRSVVLATDAGGYSAATVSLAAQIARSIKSRLRGVLIEDEDLLRLTALPFTREITLTTAEARPLDVEQLRRGLRSVARQFRQSLERETRGLKAGWSLDLERGRLWEVGLRARGDAACIIFAAAASRSRAAPLRASRRVLLLAGKSKHQARTLESILQNLAGMEIELTLVGGDTAPELTAALDDLALAHAGRLHIAEITRERLPELMRERGAVYDYAIAAQHEDAEELSRLLAALRCPLLLVA